VAEAAFEAAPANLAQQQPKAVEIVAVDPPISLPGGVFSWWFVAVISCLSLSLAGFVWWFFRPNPLQLAATQGEDAELVAAPI
jgi:hypothetical protein